MKNQLEKGMIFNRSKEVADFIKYTHSTRSDQILNALGHYCNYHKEGKYKIIIDEVFDKPIQFKATDFVYEIGDLLSNKFGSFEVIDRYFEPNLYKSIEGKNCRVYKFRCLNDGTEFVLTNGQIKKGSGCPVCGRKRFPPGHSLYDEHPEVLKYIKNLEDAKCFAPKSSKKILCKCPHCNAEKYVMISNLVKHGFSCDVCGDGVSYPNKYIQNLLEQLKVNHDREHIFEWSDNRIYDQYLEDYSMIIENHGAQHYSDKLYFGNHPLEHQQTNDEYKRKLAINNGIKYYIELDCSISDINWIKNSVMKSDLPQLLSFSEDDIDWETCHKYACNSLMRQVWEEWNNCKDIKNLVDKFHLCKTTLKTYIDNGSQCGMCDPYVLQWNGKERGLHYRNQGCCKPIHCVTDNIYFATRFDIESYYTDLFSKSGTYCLYKNIKEGRPYKGKLFVYITKEQFNEIKDKAQTDSSIEVFGDYFNIKEV